MTGFDTPDWLAGQVPASHAIQVFNLPNNTPMPVSSQFLDVSRFQSLIAQVASPSTSARHPVAVTLQWAAGGAVLGSDTFTVPNAWCFGTNLTYTVIIAPCRGDKVNITLSSDLPGDLVGLDVVGSSRSVSRPQILSDRVNDGNILIEVPGTSIPGGGTLTLYSQPVTDSVRMAVRSTSTLVTAGLVFFYRGVAGMSSAAAAPLVNASAAGTIQDSVIPGRLLAVSLTNTDSAAHTVNLWLWDTS